MNVKQGVSIAVVLAALGGCKQIIGYEAPIVLDAQAACSDGIKDFAETDVDCGGSTCPKCSAGETYALGSTTIQAGDLFVVNLDVDGTPGTGWGHTYNDGGSSERFVGVGIDAAGNVVVAGAHEGTIDFGGGPMNSANVGGGFAVEYDPGGAYKWGQSFTATPDGVVVDALGNVLLCGEFSGSVDFGAGTLTTMGTAVFVAKLAPSGAGAWSKAFVVTGMVPSVTTLVATDGAGNVLVGVNAGLNTSAGTIDFGGGPRAGAMIVAKLDPSGNHVWSNGFGVPPTSFLHGIAPYDDKQILIGGVFAETLSFGTHSVSSIGSSDIFLAKLSLP
jgi:hypothetical protein